MNLCVKDQDQLGIEKKGSGKIKIEIDLPEYFSEFFNYIELNFGINSKEYMEMVIKNEVESRNLDLNLF